MLYFTKMLQLSVLFFSERTSFRINIVEIATKNDDFNFKLYELKKSKIVLSFLLLFFLLKVQELHSLFV